MVISRRVLRQEQEKYITIPIKLDDVYARFQYDKIINWYGFKERSDLTEEAANDSIKMESGGSNNFIRASNMFSYLWRNLNKNNCDFIVNIIIPGLRNIYYENKKFLSEDEQNLLNDIIQRDLPQFEDIYNYKSLEKYASDVNMQEYQLFGSITPYDVVNIPVKTFVNLINNKSPIKIQLYPLNIIIELVYYDYDMWDSEYQEMISYIDINSICS